MKADLRSVEHVVQYEQDYNGDYTAATIGNRLNSSSIGCYSFVNGSDCVADNPYAHAEGNSTSACGYHSHAEGCATRAYNSNSHAEGSYTSAFGANSHAEGD